MVKYNAVIYADFLQLGVKSVEILLPETHDLFVILSNADSQPYSI